MSAAQNIDFTKDFALMIEELSQQQELSSGEEEQSYLQRERIKALQETLQETMLNRELVNYISQSLDKMMIDYN